VRNLVGEQQPSVELVAHVDGIETRTGAGERSCSGTEGGRGRRTGSSGGTEKEQEGQAGSKVSVPGRRVRGAGAA